MYDHQSKGISYTAGFFMLIAFGIAGLIFAGIISGPIWESMTGKSVKALADSSFDPADSLAYKILQAINQIFGYFIPTLMTAYVLHRKPFRLLGYVPGFSSSQGVLVFLIMIFALLVSGGLSYVNHELPIPAYWRLKFDGWEADYLKQVEAIVTLQSTADFFTALLIMAILPAICEETLFRGGLQNFLTRSTRNPVLAILIVSLIFSAVHFSFYGFLSRFFLGIILGLLYHYSGRMWPNILAHFLNNGIVLVALYIYKQQGKPVNQTMNDVEAGWWGLLALPVVMVLMKLFKRKAESIHPDFNTGS
jgi:membrane protease YdiL (CAAX protease family)